MSTLETQTFYITCLKSAAAVLCIVGIWKDNCNYGLAAVCCLLFVKILADLIIATQDWELRQEGK